MNKILSFCAALLISVNTYATTLDSICRDEFYENALSDTSAGSNYVKITYIDSPHSIHTFLCSNFRLFNNLRENLGISYNQYKELLKEHWHTKLPLTYQKHGKLDCGESISLDNYIFKYFKKGKEKFLKRFFPDGVYPPEKHIGHDYNIFAAAFDFGVLVRVKEEHYRIIFDSKCYVVESTL